MSDIQDFYGVRAGNTVALNALLWQYNAAAGIESLLTSKELNYVDSTDRFWCWFLFNYLFLLDADEYGIVLWSILLDYGISSKSEANLNNAFGFSSLNQNFGRGTFGSVNGSVVALPIKYAKIALLLRHFGLTSGLTVTQINAFFKMLWAYYGIGGSIVVNDNHDMTATYRLNYQPDIYTRFMFDNMGLLPRPAGVEVNWEVVLADSFGFGAGFQNFERGTFGA